MIPHLPHSHPHVRLALPLLLAAGLAAQNLPVTGTPVPELAAFDHAMTSFMATHSIEAGVLGVMHDGIVVLQRGYGWKDEAHTTPLQPDALMRIASVTKPITAAAVRKLAASGAFRLSDFVFALGQPAGGLLNITPFPSLGDPRLAEVTVQHLLDHAGGWDRDVAGDLTYREIEIAQDMGIATPPGRQATARWILGHPLQFRPGTSSAYSNIGYMMLGLVIEQYAGMPYLDYVRSAVFGGLPVQPQDLELGRTFAADQNPREPWYESGRYCQSVFDPWRIVNCPYGGWHHEARVGQGNVISATEPLLHFLQRYYISGPSIGGVRTGNEGSTWRRNHTGSFDGTNSVARQRGDGINFVVIFNERPSSGTSYASLIRDVLDSVIENQIVTWPSFRASVLRVGNGCGAIPPSLTATLPVLGAAQHYTLLADFTNVSATYLLFSGGRPAPIAAGNGCALRISGSSHVAVPMVPTLSQYLYGYVLDIPGSTALLGAIVTAQAVPVVAGGPLLGLAELSNGVELVLGHQ